MAGELADDNKTASPLKKPGGRGENEQKISENVNGGDEVFGAEGRRENCDPETGKWGSRNAEKINSRVAW